MTIAGQPPKLWWDLRRADYESAIRLFERPYVAMERVAYLMIAANAGGIALVMKHGLETQAPILNPGRAENYAIILGLLAAGAISGSNALLQVSCACARFARKLRTHIHEEAARGELLDASSLGAVEAGKHSIIAIALATVMPFIAAALVMFGVVDLSPS